MRTTFSVKSLRCLLLVLGLVLGVRQWFWMPAVIHGESMQPTLHGRQLVGVNKLIYLFGSPERGDVVAVQTGRGLLIKRVIGLPGENIGMQEGQFYINDLPLGEPYVKLQELATIARGRLGPECFLVAGDNRRQTCIAVVRRDRIVGRLHTKGASPYIARKATLSFKEADYFS